MGLIRGGIVLFIGILLFITFLALNSFATLSYSLTYDNVRDQVVPLIQGFGDSDSEISQTFGIGEFNFSQTTDEIINKMVDFCQNKTDYSFEYQGQNITIPCSTLQQAGGREAILNETLEGFVESVYYKEYNCDFFDCLNQGELPLFLVSKKAQDYWQQKFILSLIVAAVLAALIFLFMENRINWPIIIGILLALSAIPILKISSFFSALLGEPTSLLIGIFFSAAGKVFWFVFIIGLLLIFMGIAAKIMNPDFIKNLIQKKTGEQQKPQQQQQSKQKKKK